MAGSTCAGNQQSSLLGGLAGGEPVHFALASAFAVAVGRHGGEGVAGVFYVQMLRQVLFLPLTLSQCDFHTCLASRTSQH